MGSELFWLMGGLLAGSLGTAYGQRLWQTQRISSASVSPSSISPSNPDAPSHQLHPVENERGNEAEGKVGSEVKQVLPDRLAYYQALELAQFKGGFLARTAHELRSPLSSLMGLHQLILTDLCDSPEEERECVAQAYEASQKFLGLLESVIEVSKFDAGTRTLKPQPLALDNLLEDVAMAVALPFQDRNAKLRLEPSELSGWVSADYNCLRQVLIQLLLLVVNLKPSDVIVTSLPLTSSSLARTSSSSDPSKELGLQLSLEGHDASLWQESQSNWQMLQQEPLPLTSDLRHQWQPQRFSPGFSLLLQQCLLEMMGGRLEARENGALLCWIPRSEAQA